MKDSCRRVGVDIDKIYVLCDQEADRRLLLEYDRGTIGKVLPANVILMPNSVDKNRHYADPRVEAVKNILHYERVDFLFLYDNQPFLAVEITAHGYTGDNPLQRFARLYFCARESVPAIHCAPLARTRYDEIEDSRESASRRNLSSRLTQGFVNLWRIFKTPVFVVPIKTDSIGLPNMESVPNTLFPIVEHIIEHHVDRQLESCPLAATFIDLTREHAAKANTRDSEIRIDGVSPADLQRIMLVPGYLVSLMGRNYFFKGKRDKLLALRALEVSKTQSILLRASGSIAVQSRNIESKVSEIVEHDYADREISILFSGYQWRPDPISGIVAVERARIGLDNRLVLVWPRVFRNDLVRRKALLQEIRTMKKGGTCELSNRLEERMRAKGEEGDFVIGFSDDEGQFGIWSDDSKQGRICNELCDMTILNDVVIVNRRNSDGVL